MRYSTDTKALVTVTAGVTIPAAQAGVTGLFVCAVSGSIAQLLGGDPVAWGLIAGGVTALAAWYSGVSDWRTAILRSGQLEAVHVAAGETVRLEVIGGADGPYPWANWLDVPIDPEALQNAFTALANGRDLSMSSLAGRGKPLSRSEFTTLRDCLIDVGLARWLNDRAHAQGCMLTGRGRATIRSYVMWKERQAPTLPAGQNTGLKRLTQCIHADACARGTPIGLLSISSFITCYSS